MSAQEARAIIPHTRIVWYLTFVVRRTYEKRWGLFHDPEVAKEIAQLDAQRDCQRIAHLLAAYEFPWDLQRALELALFYTYGSARVSKLLDATGEFRRNGQKRYDDTRLLINHIIDAGWDSEVGRRAFDRMNRSHGHYRIPNDDFLFVLWTFMEFPIRWTRAYARRAMTDHEQRGWFHFWVGVGERMGLEGIPASKEAFDRWVDDYKDAWFVPNDASARVAAATVGILEGWVPRPLRRRVASVVYAFFDDDPQFLAAVGATKPPPHMRPLLEGALRAFARVKRVVAIGDYPTLPDSPINRTYPDGRYHIEALRPDRLREIEEAQARRSGAAAARPPPRTGSRRKGA